jgi:hypothetical protein
MVAVGQRSDATPAGAAASRAAAPVRATASALLASALLISALIVPALLALGALAASPAAAAAARGSGTPGAGQAPRLPAGGRPPCPEYCAPAYAPRLPGLQRLHGTRVRIFVLLHGSPRLELMVARVTRGRLVAAELLALHHLPPDG